MVVSRNYLQRIIYYNVGLQCEQLYELFDNVHELHEYNYVYDKLPELDKPDQLIELAHELFTYKKDCSQKVTLQLTMHSRQVYIT